MTIVAQMILALLVDDKARSVADIRAEFDERAHKGSRWHDADAATQRRMVRRALRQLQRRGLLNRTLVSHATRAEVYGWELMGASRS